MKKTIGLLLCLLAVFFASAGCGSGDPVGSNAKKTGGSQTPGVNDVLAAGMAEADGAAAENAAPDDRGNVPEDQENAAAAEEADGTAAEGIDVDLTVLSSTMVYSEVYNMLSSPDDYIGKTVKMKGTFTYYHDEAADRYYFACLIADATACCSQGFEFVLAGDAVFPRDYPDVGKTISVVGVFDTYAEGEYRYCTLREARFV